MIRNDAEKAASLNLEKGVRGSVILGKFRMYRDPEIEDGYVAVFPNEKHGGRQDGIGVPELSPKVMGPVDHGEPGVPQALTIEAYHQFCRVYKHEVNESGGLAPEWYEYRDRGFTTPGMSRWRHKFHPYKKQHLEYLAKLGDVDKPLYAVHVMADGSERKYNYVENRVFYCTWYEKIALETAEYQGLMDGLSGGYNLQIFGYDAIVELNEGNALEMYLDERKAFGHESVLYCMLTMQKDKWPWRVISK